MEHLYPKDEINTHIHEIIKASKTGVAENIQPTFQAYDISSLDGPIQKAYRDLLEYSLKEDAPENHIWFFTNNNEVEPLRERLGDDFKHTLNYQLILDSPHIIPDLTTEELAVKHDMGNTLLIKAIMVGRHDIAIMLIDAMKVAPTTLDLQNDLHESPLHSAATANKTDIVKALLQAGVNIDATNNRRDTALHVAARFGQTDTIDMLVEEGIDLLLKNAMGTTALSEAIICRQSAAASKLIDAMKSKGLDLTEKDDLGNTLLHVAAKAGDTNNIKRFIKAGLDLSAQNTDKNTVFFSPLLIISSLILVNTLSHEDC